MKGERAGERDRDRERHTHRHTETYRETGTERHTERQTESEKAKDKERERTQETDRQRGVGVGGGWVAEDTGRNKVQDPAPRHPIAVSLLPMQDLFSQELLATTHFRIRGNKIIGIEPGENR